MWGGYKGFKKGLIIEVASIVALLLGVWGGIKFSSISANYLGDMFSISEKLMPLISFALTFILIVIAVFAVAKLIQKVVKVVALSTVNKVAGAAFGILKFTLIISIVVNIVSNINATIGFIEPEMENSSFLYDPVKTVGLTLIPGLSDISINNVVENAVEEVVVNKATEKLEDLSEE